MTDTPPPRPYTLIYEPAPRSLQLRLLRSALPEPGVVFEIAWPHEPLGGGRMIRVEGEDLDRIFAAAKATAELPPPPNDDEHRQVLAMVLQFRSEAP